jgi:hypothetical protein
MFLLSIDIDLDWHLLLIVALAGVVGWLWHGRRRCRRIHHEQQIEHFVRGTVYCVLHRKKFPHYRVPVGVAFDPAHAEERNRVLVEWGAFGSAGEFDPSEWESAFDDDGDTSLDDPEAEGA